MSEISLTPDSPLAEPTLALLWTLDPASLTDAQFLRIIEVYRSERHSWNQKMKAAEAKRGAPKGSASGISLSDLGL